MKASTLLDIAQTGALHMDPKVLQTSLSKLELKSDKGAYRYLTPERLNADTAKFFEEAIDKMFATYSSAMAELVGYIRKSRQKPEHLSKAEWKQRTTEEAANVASELIPIAAQIPYVSPIRPVQSKAGKQSFKITKSVAPQTLSPDAEVFQLISFAPRNELELVANILFEFSSQTSDTIDQIADGLLYEQRIGVLREYLSSKRQTALRAATYEWEITEQLGLALQILAINPSASIAFQEFTPRHGYDVPKLVEDAGVSELFERSFDRSYELFSQLQASGYVEEACLATLLGHRLRWRVSVSAPVLSSIVYQLPDIRNESAKSLSKKFADSWAQAHPTIASEIGT